MADSQQLLGKRHAVPLGSPFDLSDGEAFQRWRRCKLTDYPRSIDALCVDITDPLALSGVERERLLHICAKTNSVLYRLADPTAGDKAALRVLAEQLGLRRMDGHLCADDDRMSTLRAMPAGSRKEGYIPYTDRPLNWHTDGYYNVPAQRIHAMLLHCVADAASGGENAVLDHELVYLSLRDKNPNYVRALMQADAMTIPANIENGVEIRAEQTGPVFSVDPATGVLHMRYTARKRNIVWKSDETTLAAVEFMERLMNDESPFIFRHRLRPGEGLISNNALHNRSGFRDDTHGGKVRLIYRARYYDRVCSAEPAVG